ncbi:MAG: hypothetical protein H6849_02430 [Alphaproteobacteria bacterium]|nr:MAG: hypothetical protein H6849_02430 [Alphaproteobacteria bacterium]
MLGSLNEWLVIFAVGIFVLRPEDIPRSMRLVARLVIRYRAWREAIVSQVESTIRDVEIEDFKAEIYKACADDASKNLPS